MQNEESTVAAKIESSARSSFARVLIRALGVTFLSVLSLAASFYAFVFLPQVQDLFFDVRPQAWQGVLYWLEFYILTILVWAVPLAFTARLLLLQNFQSIGVDSQSRFNLIVFGLPNLYLLLTSVIVFLGLFLATNNLPSPTEGCPTGPQNGPILGLCAEKPLNDYLTTHLKILFFASATAFLLLLIRNFFARTYYRRFEKLEERKSTFYRKFLLSYERLSGRDGKYHSDPSIYLLSLKPGWLNESSWIASQRAKVFMCEYLLTFMVIFSFVIIFHYSSYSEFMNTLLATRFFQSSIIVDISDLISVKRASFIPIALGAWLPFVSFLALLSNRFQAPIIVSLILVLALLGFFFGDGHDARLKTVETKALSLSLGQAVKAWKSANGCGDIVGGPIATSAPPCPRPIIVSGEGGGSRAAFLMASTLGILEDLSIANSRNTPTQRFSQQLFGISAVSGSSVGAALFLAALKVHDQTKVEELRKGIYAQNLFFLNIVNSDRNFLAQCVTYKDSLQAVLSNDFITPTVAAFLARDLLTVSRLPKVLDRAGVLETSWESAFSSVYGSEGRNPLEAAFKTFQFEEQSQTAEAAKLTSPASGISCGPVPPSQGWVPLLFANATSGETGRRVIVSPASWKEPQNPSKNAFSDSYDFDELICSEQPRRSVLDDIAAYLPSKFSPVTKADCEPVNGKMRGLDLRLSTAAGIGSRSPFVSPHATVRDQHAKAIDSLVDGGYFDNSGAVSAYELSKAIKDIDKSLNPFVLQVTSEPDWFADTSNCEEENNAFMAQKQSGLPAVGDPQLPYQSDLKILGEVGDTLTVNNTRIARGFETMIQMAGRMEQLSGKDSYAQIYVCPQQKKSALAALTGLFGNAPRINRPASSLRAITQQRRELKQARDKAAQERIKSWKDVSLSWWLSPPLQAYLDSQVYANHNKEAFKAVLALLSAQASEKPAQPQN